MSSEHKGREEINSTLNEHRRRFLQGIGAAGVAGITAGCVGDGDDDPNGNGDPSDDDPGTTPTGDAEFEVSELSPGDTSVTVGDTVEVSATITNSGDDEDTQAVALTVDGDEHDSVEVTLGEGEDESVTFDGVETADLSPGDYEYEVSSDDDSASATLTVEGVDLESLFSFDADELTSIAGTETVTGTVENSLVVAAESGEVSLSVPDGWELESESGTSFDLSSGSSQDVSWEVSIPADANGEYELTAEHSYTAAGDDDSFETSLDVVVVETLETPWGLNSGNQDGNYDSVEIDDLVLDDEIPEAVTVLGDGLNTSVREDPPEVEGTEYDELYYTEHFGTDLGYDIPVDEGVYEVTLHFAETWFGENGSNTEGLEGEGSRIFDVSINGDTVLEEFDIYAEAGGAYIAAPQTFTVAAKDGWITIESETHEDNTLFNGIEIRPAEDVASAPIGVNSGGEDVDESVEIDGLEFTDVEETDLVTAYGDTDASSTGTAVGTFTSDAPVEGTDHDLLYQTEHHGGDLSYDFYIENGTYTVTMHFAETNDALTGDARQFNVAVQGREVLSEYAIAEEVGINVATTKVAVPVEVTNNILTVASETVSDNSKFSGIEVREFDGEIPTDGLVGHWSFDEENVEDGTVLDQSDNGHDGTIQGGVTPGIDAPTGSGAEFDGEEGSTVIVPDDDELDPGEFTVSTWVRTDVEQGWPAMVGKDSSLWCGLGDGNGEFPRMDSADEGGDYAFMGDTTVNDGEWYHIVYRHAPSEGESTIHLDGALEATTAAEEESPSSDADLAIGSKSDGADWFDGSLAEVRFYDRPLGDEEIASLYMEDQEVDEDPDDPDEWTHFFEQLLEQLEELDVEEELLEELRAIDFEEWMQQVEEGDVDSIESLLGEIEPLLEEYQDEIELIIADLAHAIEQIDIDVEVVYFSLDAMEANPGEIVDLVSEFTDATLTESLENGDIWADPDSLTAFAEDLSELRSEVAESGLEFGYYTSDDEFQEIDDAAGYEILSDNLGENLELQLDVAAALEGNLDVMALIEELRELVDQL